MNRVKSIVSLVFAVVLAISPVWAQEDLDKPVTIPQPQKEWTFAVFLNADNNLDPFGVEDQQEMSKVGSSNWLNIVTLIDRERGPACWNYIEKGKVTKLKDMGELDMGDYKVFIEFVKYVKANFPAKHYVIGIWNHGSGWKAGGKIVRGVSYDDSTGNHITTNQLVGALEEAKKVLGKNIDILNFDACLMQMAEVVYACKDTCDYIVASEETEPGKGTPYDEALAQFSATKTVEQICTGWVKAFVGSYNGGSQGYEACTQSAIKTSAFPKLVDAINGLSKTIMAGKFTAEINKTLGEVQKFADTDYIDLVHFATLLKAAVKDEAIKTACDKVFAAAKGTVLANGNAMDSMKNAEGISIYFPDSTYSFVAGYKTLGFSKVSMWDEMIEAHLKAKAGDAMTSAVETGDTQTLRAFVSKASDNDKAVNQAVIEKLNFRLYSEGGLSKTVTDEATALLKELSTK